MKYNILGFLKTSTKKLVMVLSIFFTDFVVELPNMLNKKKILYMLNQLEAYSNR